LTYSAFNISGNSTNSTNKKKLAGILVGIGIFMLGVAIVGYVIYLRRMKLGKPGEFDIFIVLFLFILNHDPVRNFRHCATCPLFLLFCESGIFTI
jgi:predicted ABC-type exoprotein transport system permease subunit